MYLVAGGFAALARLHDRRWLLVPATASLLRVGGSVWERREGRGRRWALNPARLLTALGITLAIDAATFSGWLQALFERSWT